MIFRVLKRVENEFLLVLIIRVTIPGENSYPYSVDMTGFRHKKSCFFVPSNVSFKVSNLKLYRKGEKATFFGMV